ncbi:flagellar hook-associated protein FlgL [Geobacter hydrogenophilus]|uniref:Flagellar hook-associated protein 3 n=1 Tax=Geobacter hydrogenophilus TaxID=40983 RepID=A0A9W6G154_9BACT|nr:flagellar hook-associated protein FlgL [Geobacter hydrogenophilus]MBT0894236.1 flagellar hook-associated protein FlgL [Geobacter hydrogenophilus]GLI38478.1 flagellar hook-associated protein 3 [Geobacter hydrogenophilus]
MRVTQNTTANLVTNNLQVIRRRTEDLQQQASTGIKVSQPSDDPVTAQQLLNLKARVAAGDQYGRNISNGIAWLTMGESAMSEMGNVITRTKELALQMVTGTNNPDAVTAGINELNQLKQQFILLGNTQINGKYIFGGFKNDTVAFDTSGNFLGTDDAIMVEVDRGAPVQINYSGADLLRGGNPPGSTGTDIVAMFDNLATALSTNDMTTARAQLDELDNGLSQVLSFRTDIGARRNRLDAANGVIEEMKFSITKIMSDKQDVDLMQVISDLSKQQTAFDAAMAASAKISQVSLLDYLR